MASRVRPLSGLLLGVALCAAAAADVPPGFELVKKMAVPAAAGWVDTGLDVLPGQEFYFKASGEVSLQRNNPSANCGPAGLDLMTVQQPVPNQNLGALIGKIAQVVSVRRDEDTGEEIVDEIAEYVFIGAESGLAAPAKGRLYLGVNENVVRDNAGEFTVLVYRRPG
jgi:hypothetical protein